MFDDFLLLLSCNAVRTGYTVALNASAMIQYCKCSAAGSIVVLGVRGNFVIPAAAC